MQKNRITTTAATVILALAAALLGSSALAQDYPSRSINMMIGYPAGGVADLVARLVAEGMKDNLGQAVIVDNRPGAGAQIGFQLVKDAQPDGYTIGLGTEGLVTLKFSSKNYSIDPQKDVTYISNAILGDTPSLLIVTAGLAPKTLAEFLAYARANPGKLNFGSYASSGELLIAGFTEAAGIKVTVVRYKGVTPMETALASGEVDAGITQYAADKANIESGRTRVLGIASQERLAEFPNVPALIEQAHGFYEKPFWIGIVGPPNLPPAVVRRLNEAVRSATARPDMARRLTVVKMKPSPSSPEEFRALVVEEDTRLSKLAKDIGMKPE